MLHPFRVLNKSTHPSRARLRDDRHWGSGYPPILHTDKARSRRTWGLNLIYLKLSDMGMDWLSFFVGFVVVAGIGFWLRGRNKE